MEPELRARLRTLAEAATPGEWDVEGVGGIQMDGYRDGNNICSAVERRIAVLYQTSTDRQQRGRDAEYIAAANPKTILSLIAEHDALRDALREAENEAGKWHLRFAEEQQRAEALERSARAVDALWDVQAASHISEDMKHGAVTKPLALALVDLRAVLGDYGETPQ